MTVFWSRRRGHRLDIQQHADVGADSRLVQLSNVRGDVTIYHGTDGEVVEGQAVAKAETLARQRQKFFFDFLRHSLKQAEITFRLSVIFTSGGAAIVLASAVLALVHAPTPGPGYLPLVTGLTGVLITTGGGALAVHSNRARKHVTEQADRIDMKIEEDHKLERATVLIDRVEDFALKDRLNAITAMQTLGISADAETVTDRILPQRDESAVEIEPNDPSQ